MEEVLAVLRLSDMGSRTFCAERRGVGELVAGIHVAAVIVLKNDQLMTTQGGAESRSHTDIHAAVTAHHHEGNLAVRVFPTLLALVKCLHNAA